ncbi:MAG: carotenoid biosynthesis protein [Methanobacteriaceae archaeon]|jgi:putative membrane protein|nr:carotenoid biosynthesis protein [Methanobacteriaceae archaeon]
MISYGLLIGLLIILAAILIALLTKPLNLNRNRYIKIFFAILILTFLCNLLSYWIPLSIFGIAGSMSFFFTVAFVLLHSSEILGNRKTAIFFIIAFLLGLFSEAVSVQSGSYYYTIPTFFFGLVPFTIPFSWAIIIYLGYNLANLFLYGMGGEKPRRTDNIWYFIILIILLSSITGLIAVNLDMLADPVSVAPQVAQWVWVGGGPYFGIPISNFLAWFFIPLITVLIFRCYEAFSPASDDYLALNTPLNLYIIIIYIFYFLFNAFKAYEIGKIEYVLIGTATMAPFILIGLLALMLNKKRKKLNPPI